MASKGGVIIVVSGEDKTGEVFNAIKKHLDQTTATAKETSDSLGGIGQTLMHGLQAAGVTIGLREVYEGMKRIVESSVDLGMEMGHMAEQTGISVQNLSVLKYTAEQTGVPFEVLSKGFKKLSTDIFNWQHGEKVAGRAFEDLGISLSDVQAKGQDMYGVLEMVANKFQTMPNGPEKLAIAVQLFGRSGQEMIPILNQGAAGLEEFKGQAQALGLVLDESGVKKLEALHSKFVELKGAVEGGSLAFTESFAPALEGTASAFAGLTAGTNLWTIAGRQVGLTIIPLAGAVGMLYEELRQTSDEFRNNAAAITYLDSAIGAHLDWTSAERAAAAQRRDAARQEMHDTKVDHDESIAEEKSFHDKLLALKSSIEHPGVSSPADGHTPPGGALPPGEIPPPGGGRSKSDGAMTINSADLYNKQIEEQTKIADENKAFYARLDAEAAQGIIEWQKIVNQPIDMSAFKAHTPNVVLAAAPKPADYSAIEGEAEKFAHGLFDPLFNLGEKWDKQWKQIRANMLKDLGDAAESQLFGALFGDPEGRGGKSWNGGSFKGDTSRPGVSGAGGVLGSLLGMFGKKSSPVSNGTGTAGAGTVLSSVAGALQVGKGAGSGTGGVQVILNNMGTPQTVDSTQQSGGSAEAMILQVILKDQQTNGAITQGFSSLFSH
jgi:DNA-binding Xre family transcriptional regulator